MGTCMIEPKKEIHGLLDELNKVTGCYVTGGSLMRKTSKDVDIVVIGSWDSYKDEIMGQLLTYGCKVDNEFMPCDYNEFDWDGIIKCKYNDIPIDILFTKLLTITEVMNTYPLTIQQIAWNWCTGFLYAPEFASDIIKLTRSGRRQTADATERVLSKYLMYYPEHHICHNTFKLIRKFICKT